MSKVRIAHLSDPHFGTVYPDVESAIVQSLKALKPNALIITGDITQRARKNQFQAGRAFKEKLQPIPVHAVPGNHDIPLYNILARVFAPYRGFEKHFHRSKEAAFLVNGVEVVALNSTKPWRHVQGSLGPEEVMRKIAPREAGVAFRIAAFHHPMDCSSTRDETNLLRGRREILPVLQERGIDLVLGGHIHDPHVGLSEGRYPGVGQPIVIATAGTCLSWRTRLNAPNSFYLLEVDTGENVSLKITRHELNKNKVFQPGLSYFFRRGELGDWNYGEEK